MQVVFAPAFLRLLKKADPRIKEVVKETVAKVIGYYELQRKTPGLGIKHLRGELWEARAGINVRVLYSISGDELKLILAGSHDDVRRFLKR